ncbi:MAG: hypothetical protein S4CHLAM102_15740 [Chlamydiia bacterium]|nr:hypothetical protein [Chlamydiia bacterium]
MRKNLFTRTNLLYACLGVIGLSSIVATIFWRQIFPVDTMAQWISANQEMIAETIEENYSASILSFSFVYFLTVIFLLPVGGVLNVLAGYFFGVVVGTVLVVMASVVGGVLIYQGARMTVGRFLVEKATPMFTRFNDNFSQKPYLYMFILRVFPLSPFWVVSVLGGVFRMRFSGYVTTTLVGVTIPTAIYSLFGASLVDLVDHEGHFQLFQMSRGPMAISLVLLGLVFMTPLLLRKKKEQSSSD